VTPLAAPPPGTTLPGVGNVFDFRVTGPGGEAITSFAGRVTVTGTGNSCFILNEATGRFEPIQGTPIGGGQIECVVPRPGVVAIVTVLAAQATPTVAAPRPTPVPAAVGQAPGQAPGQGPGKAGAAPAQAPGKAGAAPAQAPGRAGAAPGQAPLALPATGEEFPMGALALAGLTLAGIGVASRRFIRRK
jgi:LPXTG-motif cell wall-anchored protein